MVSSGEPHTCSEEASGHRRDPHPSARNPPPLPGWSALQRANSRPFAAGKRRPEAPFPRMFPAARIDRSHVLSPPKSATSASRGGRGAPNRMHSATLQLATSRTEGRSATFAPVPGGGDLQNNGLPKAGARRALPLCVHFTAPNGTYKPARTQVLFSRNR